jgi:hypothetical protein
MGVDSMPNESASGSGAAYVFVRSGTTWSQQAYLKASNQLVRYYGWYSNKMRGQRLKQDAQKEAERESAEGESPALGTPEVIDVSGFVSRRRPSRKWRDLIQKVWEADPLLCPTCHEPMRIIALIDEAEVIERILRHLGLW